MDVVVHGLRVRVIRASNGASSRLTTAAAEQGASGSRAEAAAQTRTEQSECMNDWGAEPADCMSEQTPERKERKKKKHQPYIQYVHSLRERRRWIRPCP